MHMQEDSGEKELHLDGFPQGRGCTLGRIGHIGQLSRSKLVNVEGRQASDEAGYGRCLSHKQLHVRHAESDYCTSFVESVKALPRAGSADRLQRVQVGPVDG